ncbi:hypothetical protein [Paenibacillus glycanilyticus]|uniref:Uncharacterized protein n=1 Tax=Paenibacillus glycanilyticus TaxID=126569 RepID=A0ABQ6GEL8_9BACL|nr:hypothetical protein [Paenibacillus glycanilyticus]GLX68031.1 hypothetical protein MU1_23760 [Paenibacillus glycanilyticus]
MNSKIFFLIGTLFILCSGVMYSIERFSRQIMFGEIQNGFATHDGSIATDVVTIQLDDNVMVIPFLIIGIALILISFTLIILYHFKNQK